MRLRKSWQAPWPPAFSIVPAGVALGWGRMLGARQNKGGCGWEPSAAAPASAAAATCGPRPLTTRREGWAAALSAPRLPAWYLVRTPPWQDRVHVPPLRLTAHCSALCACLLTSPPFLLPYVRPQVVTPHLNLGPFITRAPITVRLGTPAIRVHAMFVSLSLRWVLGCWSDGPCADAGLLSAAGLLGC